MPYAAKMPDQVRRIPGNCDNSIEWETRDVHPHYRKPFKTRFAKPKATFNSRSKRTATELSNYIWDLKDRAVEYHTTWRIVKQAPSFNSNYHRCNLCSWERYHIIFQPQMASLNKRSELLAACRHERKYTLAHCKV